MPGVYLLPELGDEAPVGFGRIKKLNWEEISPDNSDVQYGVHKADCLVVMGTYWF